MEEIWKDIKGFEGTYQISNYGNVRSKERKIIQKHGNSKYIRKIRSRIVKFSKNKNGYRTVSLCFNGNRITKNIHKLVAEAFISNPNNCPCINHKDGDKQNNNVRNLEWCTYKYNTQEAIRLGNFYFINNKHIEKI